MIEGARLFKEEIREEVRKEFEKKLAESEDPSIRIPIRMLQRGFPVEEIADITELPEDFINMLKVFLPAEN